jgi:hypothetical protein
VWLVSGPGPFIPEGRPPSSHWIGAGWTSEKWDRVVVAVELGIETRRRAHSLSLYLLSYLGFQESRYRADIQRQVVSNANFQPLKATFGQTCVLNINRCTCDESVSAS